MQGRDSPPFDGPAIALTQVGVRFRIPTDRILSFKEYVLHLLTSRIEHREFDALTDVTCQIDRGQVMGIVGRNGAGKSTLLKVISRVLHPTRGRVVVRGQLAPLLELGAGFHPDLTGRENVVMNGTILGYAKSSIEQSLEAVAEFSELEAFLDAPLRTYSSGMVARLGFAVATQFRPDILVLDEVLAVGDLAFQEKCLERIRGFRAQGTTILLVSHALETIQTHCDSVIWLENGRLAASGTPSEVLPLYRNALAVQEKE